MGCISNKGIDLKDIQAKTIKDLQYEFEIEIIGNGILLKDQRLATYLTKEGIFICSIDISNKTWKIDIMHKLENKVEGEGIFAICELCNNKLAVSYYGRSPIIKNESQSDISDIDEEWEFIRKVQIWKIEQINLTLINELKQEEMVSNIVSLPNNNFATLMPYAHKVIIWKDNDNSFTIVSEQIEEGDVAVLIQLKGKDELVTTGELVQKDDINYFVTFWDLKNKKKKHTIKGYGVTNQSEILELSSGNIALSCCKHSSESISNNSNNIDNFIIIIDTNKYTIIKKIESDEHFFGSCFLSYFNEESFFAVESGIFVQISSKDFSIMYDYLNEDEIQCSNVIIMNGGKYVIIKNKNSGFSIFKIILD